MHRTLRSTFRLVLAAVAFAPALRAQSAAQLPAASQLVERHNAAIGGRDAAIKVFANSRTVGTFEMPAAGLKAETQIFTRGGGEMVTLINMPGMGEMRDGITGGVAWSSNPIQGPRLKNGKELAAAIEMSDPLASLRDPQFVTAMQTVEQTTMGGEACYKVRVTWKSGRESHDCYSTASGLRIGEAMALESPQGVLQISSVYRDYKPFGVVKVPTRIEQEMMGQQMVMTVSAVDTASPIAPAVLELPADVKALVKPAAPRP